MTATEKKLKSEELSQCWCAMCFGYTSLDKILCVASKCQNRCTKIVMTDEHICKHSLMRCDCDDVCVCVSGIEWDELSTANIKWYLWNNAAFLAQPFAIPSNFPLEMFLLPYIPSILVWNVYLCARIFFYVCAWICHRGIEFKIHFIFLIQARWALRSSWGRKKWWAKHILFGSQMLRLIRILCVS